MRSLPDFAAGVGAPALVTITRGLTTLRFTTADTDVTIGTDTWTAEPGAALSSISFPSDGTPNNADVQIMTAVDGLVEPGDGVRGILDGWPISIKLFDPADPAGTATEMVPGSIIGSVAEDTNGLATIATNGPLVAANGYVTEHFALACRADLYDDRCKVDPAGFSNATTGQATGTFVVTLDGLPDIRASDATWYVLGSLYVLSGPLNGYPKMPIRAWNPATFEVTLFLPVSVADIPAGTTLQIRAGCNLTREMCFSRFDNIVNGRFETFVPPPDATFR
jgi:uncharacterized phage protein (TIGR02218 family)